MAALGEGDGQPTHNVTETTSLAPGCALGRHKDNVHAGRDLEAACRAAGLPDCAACPSSPVQRVKCTSAGSYTQRGVVEVHSELLATSNVPHGCLHRGAGRRADQCCRHTLGAAQAIKWRGHDTRLHGSANAGCGGTCCLLHDEKRFLSTRSDGDKADSTRF